MFCRFLADQVFVVPDLDHRRHIVFLTTAERCTGHLCGHGIGALSTVAGDWFRHQVLSFSCRFLGRD